MSSIKPSFFTPTIAQTLSSTEASPLQSMLKELSAGKSTTNPISMVAANLSSAVGALWVNRLRTFLTALGIFIGVAAVVTMLTLVQGAGAYISGLIGNAGNNIFISPSGTRGGVALSSGFSSSLTPKDFQAIVNIPHVAYATPLIGTSSQVIYGNQNWNTSIQGVSVDDLIISNVKVGMGDWFTDADGTAKLPVAVLGDTVYHNLFDVSGDAPIGRKIRIGGQIFQVVGVLQSQGFGNDDAIYVPIQTMQVRLRNAINYDSIQVQIDSTSNVNRTMAAIVATLKANHHITGNRASDFQTFNFGQVLQQIEGFLTLARLYPYQAVKASVWMQRSKRARGISMMSGAVGDR